MPAAQQPRDAVRERERPAPSHTPPSRGGPRTPGELDLVAGKEEQHPAEARFAKSVKLSLSGEIQDLRADHDAEHSSITTTGGTNRRGSRTADRRHRSDHRDDDKRRCVYIERS